MFDSRAILRTFLIADHLRQVHPPIRCDGLPLSSERPFVAQKAAVCPWCHVVLHMSVQDHLEPEAEGPYYFPLALTAMFKGNVRIA